ncbi:alpha-1,2-fucosyltransferase [Treponema bryantii]|uniref:alpha-1,2-fucosyltransferase n=1 Tax=Treponema bryantii TaxID=163 RepID=UPI0003B5C861|nr:alpha-1,2-fucosyltransferase [Treponema bryantii]
MIVISMGGGLGNQMFEYAFYTQLKHLYPKSEIKVDTKYAFPYSHNGIEVFKIFGLNPPEANWKEVHSLVKTYPIEGNKAHFIKFFLYRILRKANLVEREPTSFCKQKDFTEFYNSFFELPQNKSFYLYGPFVNYNYFAAIHNEIMDLYTFPEITDVTNIEYKRKIESSHSISIHIRRGDYITEGVPLVPDAYYREALVYINKKIEDPHFFVFTDDKDYCKSLFSDNQNFTIVEGNTGANSFRDMQLMSLCKHNIIANSTFSFWGAFLNKNSEKIVIAPNIAFKDCSCPYICPDWIIL